MTTTKTGNGAASRTWDEPMRSLHGITRAACWEETESATVAFARLAEHFRRVNRSTAVWTVGGGAR